ncbi:MAG: PorT family protein [Bacteroidales bacterium]|nr:PorT family protein [Bacteroidales bacterium]
MKLKIYLFAFLTFITFTTIAQDFHGGVLGGLAASEISGDRLQGPNKAGIYVGAFVNRYISELSSFQMELNFIQKGSRENPDSANNYQSYLLRLNYIELPVHYRYDFAERGTLEAGLSLGVLIHNYEEANGYEWTSGPEFRRTDLSFNIGAFYSLTERLRINVRYSNSIMAVRPHSQGQTYRWNKGQYNEVLSFVLFYEL